MQELNYISFENEFVKFCSGFFNTLLETDGIVKPTRENVDRYILLSAAMTKEEEVELLGRDRSSFDKTALSKMRTGERPVVKGIVETFSRDKAIDIAVERFIKIIPEVISPYEYSDLSAAIWNIIQTDVFIPEEVSITLECLARSSEISIGKGKVEGLCLFLATALKFAILRDTLIRGTPNLSPRVAFAIKEFKKDKKESEFLKALVCDMFAELEKQKIRVGDKFALDTVNHTKYTDDDFVELMAAIAPLQDIFSDEFMHYASLLQIFAIGIESNRIPPMASQEGYNSLFAKFRVPPAPYIIFPPSVIEAQYVDTSSGEPIRYSMRVDEQGKMICENAEVLKDYKWTSRQE